MYAVRVFLGIALMAGAGCTAYEYEEEVFLSVDGSGTIRVSGSAEILPALHGVDDGSVAAMESLFDGPGLRIDSVRETRRDGRRFVHVVSRFDDWNELCAHPAFSRRECELTETSDSQLALHLALAPQSASLPDGVPADAPIAIRFHLPSAVRFHNAPAGIERGNILAWTREAAAHFEGTPLVVDIRFEKRSVLATTLGVVGTALGIVVASVVLALFVTVRKGRRQLAEERLAD